MQNLAIELTNQRTELNRRLDKYRVSGIIHQHLDMYLSGGQSDSDADAPAKTQPQDPPLPDVKSEPVEPE